MIHRPWVRLGLGKQVGSLIPVLPRKTCGAWVPSTWRGRTHELSGHHDPLSNPQVATLYPSG